MICLVILGYTRHWLPECFGEYASAVFKPLQISSDHVRNVIQMAGRWFYKEHVSNSKPVSRDTKATASLCFLLDTQFFSFLTICHACSTQCTTRMVSCLTCRKDCYEMWYCEQYTLISFFHVFHSLRHNLVVTVRAHRCTKLFLNW